MREKHKILIVDDEAPFRSALRRLLGKTHIILEADTGAAGLMLAEREDPDLVLLDIGLPDGDGFNVVDWLRQRADLARLPLVVYSGRELSQDQRRQLTLGPTYFLAKTRVQPQQLEALVLTMLRSARQTDEAATPESAVPNP